MNVRQVAGLSLTVCLGLIESLRQIDVQHKGERVEALDEAVAALNKLFDMYPGSDKFPYTKQGIKLLKALDPVYAEVCAPILPGEEFDGCSQDVTPEIRRAEAL